MIVTGWIITCDGCDKQEVGDPDNDGLLSDWYEMKVEHDFTHTTAHACTEKCIGKAVANAIKNTR